MVYIREHREITIAHVVRDEMMSAREATEALKYGVRHGVIVRKKYMDECASNRFRYCLSGECLSPNDSSLTPSFDALLTAWGTSPNPHRPNDLHMLIDE